MPAHFQTLARYNRIANQRLYAKVAELDDAEYRKHRAGSFGSIHGLLNHILLGDRIWMSRFEGGGESTPRLNTVLLDDFRALRAAREQQDALIESFFDRMDADFIKGSFSYVNNAGKHYIEDAGVAIAHFFNHQTHHRGQVHVMLSEAGVQPPPLDLHRIINP